MLARNFVKLASSSAYQRALLKTEMAAPMSMRFKSVKSMQQVDVDDPSLQAQLGELKMGLIRKAEKENLKRAKKHVKYRRRDWMIGGICIGIIIGVYSYTIWAMQQETFLDDFEVPNPIPEDEEDK